MNTYPIVDPKQGECPFAFEIENAYVSRRTVARLLGELDGVTEVGLGGRFGSSNDVRVEFKYGNRDYVVLEPFGDNSRYWIGPKNSAENTGDISEVENVFKRYQPPLHRTLIGDILTLRVLKRLAGRN
jgi:hypothetical protein